MKKILIGLLFTWILIFSFIGFTHIDKQMDGEVVENEPEGQTITVQ